MDFYILEYKYIKIPRFQKKTVFLWLPLFILGQGEEGKEFYLYFFKFLVKKRGGEGGRQTFSQQVKLCNSRSSCKQ